MLCWLAFHLSCLGGFLPFGGSRLNYHGTIEPLVS
jgi:hypothetical protein